MKIAFVFLHGRLGRMLDSTDEIHSLEVKNGNIPKPTEFFLGAFELKKKGHDVTIFELIDIDSKGMLVAFSQNVFKNKWFPVKTSVGTVVRAYSLVKELNEFDVVVATTASISYSLGFWKKTGRLKPSIVSIPCGVLNYSITFFRRITTKWLVRCMSTQLYGDGELDELKKAYDIPANNIEVNYFGVDTEFWKLDADRENEGYILSIGNDSNRDFELLVDAANELECKVKILTKRKISRILPENVEKIEGAWKTQELTDSEVRTLYQRAKIVVVPLQETLQPSGQSVALQAMACGKPVVITRTKGLWSAAHLQNWENIIFVKPGNLQQLVSVLERLLSDDSLSEQIGENARKYVLTYGNIREFSKRLEMRVLECR